MSGKRGASAWIGDDAKILNDMTGTVTVSVWREQAERAAERMCGQTGMMMLKGIFPSFRRGTFYDDDLMTNTLKDMFKRGSRKYSQTWIADEKGDHNSITLTTTGEMEFGMRLEVIAEELQDIISDTLKKGSNASKYFESLLRRRGKTKEDNLREFYDYSVTTLVQGAQSAKKTVGNLIRDMKVVAIKKGEAMPNPNDMTPEKFIKQFKVYDSEAERIQRLLSAMDIDFFENGQARH